MAFKPLGRRVLVERSEEMTKTASGIYIPDNAKEKPATGKVIAIGDKTAEKGKIKVGDTVVFGKYAGTEITIDGKDLLVMNDSDILGIIE
ncbi:MAG: co-chaperone GroES [Campylobacterales bacterium]